VKLLFKIEISKEEMVARHFTVSLAIQIDER
jgi:hypothetical protein